MLNRRVLLLAPLFVPAVRAWAAAGPVGRPRTDIEISALLKDLIDAKQASLGIVAGMSDAQGRRLISYGRSGAPNGRALDGDTVFEIGSLTKLFTALILADMVVRREVAMEDPVGKYLPAGVQMPNYDGKPVRLIDIATYAPGLPGWPDNMPPLGPEKPFPAYTIVQLYASLNGRRLEAAPGTQYIYSNYGYGLLGHVLALRAGVSYEDLVVSRICAPLGMDSTRIIMTPSMQSRLAPGHNPQLRPVPNWDLPPAIAGAGAFRSTPNDMFGFLDACLGRKETSLTPALATMLDIRRPANAPGLSAGSGWFISTDHDDELVWKDGATAGYSTFIGYSVRNRVGTILFSNAASGRDITPLGKHFLNDDFPFQTLK